jgi:hypothetical protein
MSYPDGPDTPGWSNNDDDGQGYFNTYLGGGFDGPGNPNTQFNPNIGTYAKPLTFTYGGGPNTTATIVAPMQHQQYSEWNWEEILYQVLGIGLPDRTEVSTPRWTGINTHSSGTDDADYIYGVTWGVGADGGGNGNGQDALIYLSPALQAKGGPWDVYVNTPYGNLWDPSTGFTPSNPNLWLDTSTFLEPIYSLSAVQDMFLNSTDRLGGMSSALQGDSSQFKGKAGAAFAQLIHDLLSQTQSAVTTMGVNSSSSSYAGMLAQASQAALLFVTSIWNAYAAWTNVREHSPLGAILEALIVGNVVVTENNPVTGELEYAANPNMDPNFTMFGPLSTDAAWVNVEKLAKTLWAAAITANLDYPSQAVLKELVTYYDNAIRTFQPLPLKAPPPLSQPNVLANPNNSGGGNLNLLTQGMDKNFSAIANMMLNMDKGLDGAFNSIYKIFPNLEKSIGSAVGAIPNVIGSIPNILGSIPHVLDSIPNVLGSIPHVLDSIPNVLGSIPTMDKSLFDNFNSLSGGLGDLDKNISGDFNSLGGPLGQALTSLGPSGQGELIPGPLVNGQPVTQGIMSGMPTPQGIVGGQPVTQALVNGQPVGAVGQPLTQGIVSSQPIGTVGQLGGPGGQSVTSDLQDALAGTDQTQDALDQALASGQIPSSGPLHDAVTGALADNAQTQAALNQALASGNPSTAALQTALADNGKTQTALNQALASGEVPSTGTLSSDLGTALAGTSQTQAALNNALAGGTSGGTAADASLHTALGDNSQTRAALNQALASGQVPATGPLHSAVETALTDSGKTQAALTKALASGSPSQLQTALADNNQTRAALQRALASGQVPSTGPLHTALENALTDTGKTQAAINHALVASTPGGASISHAMTSDSALQSALHKAVASGQVPKVGTLHDAVQSALSDSGKVKNALNQALAGGGTLSTAAIHRALTDNQALQSELHKALASGQVPRTGPLHTDLENALADSKKMGTELHQALASQGVAAEPGASVLSGGQAALTGGVTGLGSTPLISATGTPVGTGAGGVGSGGVGGLGTSRVGTSGLGTSGVGTSGLGTSGLGGSGLASGTAAAPVSSGRFVAPASGSSGSAASEAGGFPMYSPMAGGMGMGGMGGGGGQTQERERTTWLAEDEDVWGTEPDVAPQVLGRDFVDDDDDEMGDYVDGDRDAAAARRAQTRLYGR